MGNCTLNMKVVSSVASYSWQLLCVDGIIPVRSRVESQLSAGHISFSQSKLSSVHCTPLSQIVFSISWQTVSINIVALLLTWNTQKQENLVEIHYLFSGLSFWGTDRVGHSAYLLQLGAVKIKSIIVLLNVAIYLCWQCWCIFQDDQP